MQAINNLTIYHKALLLVPKGDFHVKALFIFQLTYHKSFRVNLVHNGLIEHNIMAVQTVMQDGSSSFLNRTQLIKLRYKAMRAGVWFRALPRIDRVLVDLTIKVAENIHSAHLAKSIFAVISKLDGLLESSVLSSLRAIGRPLAEKLSLTAQKWGNVSAKSWPDYSSFAIFLAIMHTNK